MSVKYRYNKFIHISRRSETYPNRDFVYANIASGNPGIVSAHGYWVVRSNLARVGRVGQF
jgi:hypothetical protein